MPQDLQQQGYPQDVFLGQVQAPPACQALRVDGWVDGWMFAGGCGIPSLKRWDCWKMNRLSPPLGVQGLGELAGYVSPGTHRRWWLLDAKETTNLDFKPTFVSYSADVPTKGIGIVVGRQRWMQHSIRTWIHVITSNSVRWRFLEKAVSTLKWKASRVGVFGPFWKHTSLDVHNLISFVQGN